MIAAKSIILLGAPLLAAASDILPSRIQRRHALLELLERHHERRADPYNNPPTCSNTPGSNEATFTSFSDATKSLASPLKEYVVQPDGNCALTLGKCQSSCITAGSDCLGLIFLDLAVPTCSLLGLDYDGTTHTTGTQGLQLMGNAGTTSASTGQSSGQTVATCATAGTLDTVAANGACTCGEGRTLVNPYTCTAVPIPQGSYSDAKPITTITKPVTINSAYSWDDQITGVPAVMNANQCATICANDSGNCEAFLLEPGQQLNSCWKIGAAGTYTSPAGFPVHNAASRKRQNAGSSFGGPGDVFGQPASSNLQTNAFPSATQGGKRMRVRRAEPVQW